MAGTLIIETDPKFKSLADNSWDKIVVDQRVITPSKLGCIDTRLKVGHDGWDVSGYLRGSDLFEEESRGLYPPSHHHILPF